MLPLSTKNPLEIEGFFVCIININVYTMRMITIHTTRIKKTLFALFVAIAVTFLFLHVLRVMETKHKEYKTRIEIKHNIMVLDSIKNMVLLTELEIYKIKIKEARFE